MPASTVMLWARRVALLPTSAWFLTSAKLTATAAPTPVPPSVVTADPSAEAVASMFASERTARLPPASMVLPPTTEAWVVLSAILTATAAATLTVCELELPCESVLAVDAVGLEAAELLSRLPRLFAALSPRPREPAAFLSTPLSSLAEFLSSPFSPFALAFAVAVVLCVLSASTVTSPPVVIERAAVAVVLSVTTETETAAPTAASVPVASPSVFVVALPEWVARTPTAPEAVRVLPVPSRAVVSSVATVTAAIGTTPTPPFAPPWASVAIRLAEVASTFTAPAPVSVEVFCSSALVVLSTTFTATEAPMPTFLPVASSFGSAFASLELSLAAMKFALPPPVRLAAAVPRNSARVLTLPTLTDTDPATPTPSEPAPAADVAADTWRLSASTVVMSARTDNPLAATVAPVPTKASLVTLPTLIATAAPTPAAEPPVALPSASAVASALADEWMSTAPPAVTERPAAMAARAVESAMLTATAAATLTDDWPLLSPFLSAVDADGVAPPAALLRPPLDVATESPRLRFLVVFWSTLSPDVLPSASASSPPLELAFAAVVVDCLLSARRSNAPPRTRARSIVASVLSTMTSRPNDAPIAALLLPSASPSALLVAVPRCTAVTAALVAESVAPVPMCAIVSSLPMVMAATGTMAVPPLAPARASELMALLELAETVTAPAPVSDAAFSISARVTVSAMLIATEAPTPRLSPVTFSRGSALAVFPVVLLARSRKPPLPMIVVFAPLSSVASLRMIPELMASEPAMPTLAALAPEVACAPKRSAVVSTASTAMVEPCNCAALAMKARASLLPMLMATATPMPVLPLVDDASATVVKRPAVAGFG